MKELTIFFENHYLKIMTAGLVILILFEWIHAIQLYSQVHELVRLPLKPPILKKVSSVSVTTKQAMLKANLFGDYVPADVGRFPVKQSTINAKVVGILYVADDEKKSEVMLELTGHHVKSFHLEDTIPGDAVIKRITADDILVMHHGTMERLSLPKNEVNFSPPSPILKAD